MIVSFGTQKEGMPGEGWRNFFKELLMLRTLNHPGAAHSVLRPLRPRLRCRGIKRIGISAGGRGDRPGAVTSRIDMLHGYVKPNFSYL